MYRVLSLALKKSPWINKIQSPVYSTIKLVERKTKKVKSHLKNFLFFFIYFLNLFSA